MTHLVASRLRLKGIHRRIQRGPIYRISDRLHEGRIVDVAGDEIATTVSAWLAEMGAHSALVDDLARAANAGDWPATHAIAEYLSVDVAVAA